jgi:hypothetical protein
MLGLTAATAVYVCTLKYILHAVNSSMQPVVGCFRVLLRRKAWLRYSSMRTLHVGLRSVVIWSAW